MKRLIWDEQRKIVGGGEFFRPLYFEVRTEFIVVSDAHRVKHIFFQEANLTKP